MKMDTAGAFDFSTWTLEAGQRTRSPAAPPSARDLPTRRTPSTTRRGTPSSGSGWRGCRRARGGRRDEDRHEAEHPAEDREGRQKASRSRGIGDEVTEASAWYESVYGTGAKARDKTS